MMASTPAREVSAPERNGSRFCFWLLAAMTACFCAFVLSLPVFPTEDGPIHLYFATILGDLLSHSSPLYAQYYYIHHVLPPYSLHYYLLILMMKAVSAVMAEKILICFILVNFAFGFRYLVTAIGAAGDVLSLLVVALLFNWPLGMGFENFSLSVGFACWALGIWTRLQHGAIAHPVRYRAGFVLLLAVMTLTHPVPVVLTVGFAMLDLTLCWVAGMAWKQASRAMPVTGNMVTCLAGASTLIYIYRFTDTHRSVQEARSHTAPFAELVHYSKLYGLAFFGGSSFGAALYHVALYIVFGIGLVTGLVAACHHLRLRHWNAQLSWFVASMVLICAQPFMPVDINGSHLFAERLVIFIWIALLAAGSGAGLFSNLFRRSTVILSVAVTVGILVLGQEYIAPAARMNAEMEKGSFAATGRVGVLLPAVYDAYSFNDDLRFYPFDWAGTRYFRRTGTVLLNTPWLDLPILPLAATPSLLTNSFPAKDLEDYRQMRSDLIESAHVRARVLGRADFIVFNDPNRHASQGDLDQILNADPAYHWSCQRFDWYVVCTKQ